MVKKSQPGEMQKDIIVPDHNSPVAKNLPGLNGFGVTAK